jgi:hypothetical protein
VPDQPSAEDMALRLPFKPHRKKYDDPTQIPHDIDEFTSRISAIRSCAKHHILHARETAKAFNEDITEQLASAITAMPKPAVDGRSLSVRVDRNLMQEVTQQALAPHHDTIAKSLFIFAFSTFDAFLGTLTKTFYREQPDLLQKLNRRPFLRLPEVRGCRTIEDATEYIIDKDISSMLRKSYTKSFQMLATRFNLGTLSKVDCWGEFIECSQRRNLITHCAGVVSPQYVSVCEKHGVPIDKSIETGKTKLDVSASYLDRTLDLLHEIGVKLANTLWRKCLPEKTWISEKFLAEHVYERLLSEQWPLAETISRFALGPPLKSESDLQNKMIRINLAQSLKWAGKETEAKKVLELDWSGSIRDFRLAVDVLHERYDNAIQLMRQIGPTGELVNMAGYREWPLFREFRKNEQFRTAFLEIYGEPLEKPMSPRITVVTV